jgi:hypothetical protein
MHYCQKSKPPASQVVAKPKNAATLPMAVEFLATLHLVVAALRALGPELGVARPCLVRLFPLLLPLQSSHFGVTVSSSQGLK